MTKRTEAQKRADKAYRERRGGVDKVQKTIGATVSPTEAERIKSALQSVGLSNADALKRVVDRIGQGDDKIGRASCRERVSWTV